MGVRSNSDCGSHGVTRGRRCLLLHTKTSFPVVHILFLLTLHRHHCAFLRPSATPSTMSRVQSGTQASGHFTRCPAYLFLFISLRKSATMEIIIKFYGFLRIFSIRNDFVSAHHRLFHLTRSPFDHPYPSKIYLSENSY